MKKLLFLLLILSVNLIGVKKGFSETGYRLWLRYDLIDNTSRLESYKAQLASLVFKSSSRISESAKAELKRGLAGLLGRELAEGEIRSGMLIAGTPESSPFVKKLVPADELKGLNDGFIIRNIKADGGSHIVIAGESDLGVLYGAFHLLKLIQSHTDLENISVKEIPKVQHRILNHWDNMDGTIERGYAGSTLWNWHKLPGYTETRYTDYARANASIGINGTVLNNVNANALVLTPQYLVKVAALADVFRSYGIKVYLSARFSAPVEIGGLKTADPQDPRVQQWWIQKANEIYKLIPDFGGFLVKANSEGQPGPQNYGRTHADGANMLATALEKHKGIVMWRAFVYDNNVPVDRAMQSYNEFKPLDGKFKPNVLVQVKNGPVDFQPREPFHPLFGAMPSTPIMMEFQITQEYLGLSTNLVYLASLFEEVLQSDTYSKGKGSTVSGIISGKTESHPISGMAGVANTGSDLNWTGHHFGQANWYSFGRLAWDPDLSASRIADEWIRLTFSNRSETVDVIKKIMMGSREAAVNYMTPLGLHHIMARNHHWGPGPWVSDAGRADWTSVYYHKADSVGVGFDRTAAGSNYVSQYFPEAAKVFSDRNTIDEKYLLWFHRVKWNEKMRSGKTLWEEMVTHYYSGVSAVKEMQNDWKKLKGAIDAERYMEVEKLLEIQYQEARWWRNACVLYFQSFSKLPMPAGFEKPEHDLAYYQNLKFHFVPGIKPE